MSIKGFFAGSELAQVKQPTSLTPKCGACGFYKSCSSPKMTTHGRGEKRVLIVSSFPGQEEDKAGRQVVGKSGLLLQSVLKKFGVDLNRDCWLDNALICKPDGLPTNKHVDYCRPNIVKRIKELNPEKIILIGGEAVQSVIGWLWKEGDLGGIGRWAGWKIPCQSINAWICPTLHPAYVMREQDGKNPIPNLLFERHIKNALELEGRPWEKIPDWTKGINVELNTDKVAKILDRMIQTGGTVAVDYECNMLKPEGKGARILSAAVCWNGRYTIAYPWHGAAIEATRQLWRSRLPKIAANLKFEDRWTRKILQTETRNWFFDTMIGAHAMDSRAATKSLKFQSFVQLGMDSYNDHIERFFESKGSMEPNGIESQISLNDLLLYNGIDALLEYKLAEVQIREIGLPLPEGMST